MRILYFFFLIILVSCQVSKSKTTSSLSVVDIDNKYTTPEVTSINSSENVYGPLASEENNNLEQSVTMPIIALDFAPALYNSLAYIGLLEKLESKKIKPKLFITSGFSLIPIFLYSKYQNTNRVNFKMFSLMSKLKSKKVFSQKWKNIINDFLLDEFKNTKQESLPSLVLIPTYKNKRLSLIYSGEIVKNILNSINLKKIKNNFLLRPTSHYRNDLKQFGIDLSFNLSAISKEVTLKYSSGFVYGVYTKLSGYSHYEANDYISLGVENKTIDNIKNTVDLMNSINKKSEEISEMILKKINSWIERNRND